MREDLQPPNEIGAVHRYDPLTNNANNPATGGIWRAHGDLGTAVVKIAQPPAGGAGALALRSSDDPTHWNHWQREILAFETGFDALRDFGPAQPRPNESPSMAWPCR